MGDWGGETLRHALCVCTCVRACTPQMVCGVCEVAGKCFLYVPAHTHMSMPSVSAVICAGTKYHSVQELLIASLKVLLNITL